MVFPKMIILGIFANGRQGSRGPQGWLGWVGVRTKSMKFKPYSAMIFKIWLLLDRIRTGWCWFKRWALGRYERAEVPTHWYLQELPKTLYSAFTALWQRLLVFRILCLRLATIALRAQSLFSPPVFTGGRSQDHHLHSAHGIDNKLIPVDVVFAIPNPHSIPQRRWIFVGNGGLLGDDQSVTGALSHGGPPAHHCPSPNLLNQPSLMYIEITSTPPHMVATIYIFSVPLISISSQ